MKDDETGLHLWGHQIAHFVRRSDIQDRAARALIWFFLGWLMGVFTFVHLQDAIREIIKQFN